MRIPTIPTIVQMTKILVIDGRPTVVYRSNSSVPQPSWGLTVPSILDGARSDPMTTRYLIFSNYIAELRIFMELLVATQHLPDNSNEFGRIADWALTLEARRAVQTAQDEAAKPTTAMNQAFFRSTRDKAILKYAGEPPFNTAKIQELANRFYVTTRVIERALDAKVKAPQGLSPMSQVRRTAEYKFLQRAVQIARGRAYNENIHCDFSIRDLLKREQGIFKLPTECPVTGIPLDYQRRTADTRESYATNPYGVRVWRRSPAHSLDKQGTVIMCALAVRMIEGQTVNDETTNKVVREFPRAFDAYREWAGKYGV